MSNDRKRPRPGLEQVGSVCLAVLVLATLGYVAQVRVPVYVHAPGELRTQGAVAPVAGTRAGLVTDVRISGGQRVAQGEALIELGHDGGEGDPMRTLLQAQRDELRARLDSTLAALEKIDGETASAQAARLSLSTLESQTSLALVDAEARLMALESRGRSVLRAPRSGRIVDLRAQVGVPVEAGQVLAAIVDADPRFHVVARVAPADIGRLARGAAVEVGLPPDAGGARVTLPGTISDIGVLPAPGRAGGVGPAEFEVKVELDPGDAALPSLAIGGAASVRLRVDERSIAGWIRTRFGG
jgi:multidrug resistance efflux pump